MVHAVVYLTHETTPNFIPVRAKYDTGCDVNFIPKRFVEEHGLTRFMTLLGGEDAKIEGQVFVGLNNQEYVIYHDITLQWCATNMHQVRTTKFHVADNLPYEMVLGDPFILENRVFHPKPSALPLRRKRSWSFRMSSEST
jgi:hypothetical protein